MKYMLFMLYCPAILAMRDATDLIKKQPTSQLEAAIEFIDNKRNQEISRIPAYVSGALLSYGVAYQSSLKKDYCSAIALYAIGSACLLATKRINDRQRNFYNAKQAIIKELQERAKMSRL